MAISFIILTGMPGSGKSTMVKKIVEELRVSSNANIKGFYTEECRNSSNERIGFDIKTFDGENGILARISSEIGRTNRPTSMNCRVGKYVVYVNEFEKLCMKYFENINSDAKSKILILDEIGKMELFSEKFESAIKKLMFDDQIRNLRILATVPLKSPSSLVDKIKNHPRSILFHITKSNRNDLYDEILNKVKEIIN